MLKTRVITAVIGFIIALGAITLGGPVYDVLITLLALLGGVNLFCSARLNMYACPLYGVTSVCYY